MHHGLDPNYYERKVYALQRYKNDLNNLTSEKDKQIQLDHIFDHINRLDVGDYES